MNKSKFKSFFLFILTSLVAVGLVILVASKIMKLEMSGIYFGLYMGFCLFVSIGFGIGGNIYGRTSWKRIIYY